MAPAWVLNHFTPAGREFQRQMKVMQEFGNGLIRELVADALDKRRRVRGWRGWFWWWVGGWAGETW